ncbi:MAG TPA: PDZ domain-containing protein [Gemmatimonadota bacterium]|nr:PDZ domain-containing protein [Gemmatimonadota bacterium]
MGPLHQARRGAGRAVTLAHLALALAALALAACASRPPAVRERPLSPVNYYVRVVRAGVDRYDVSIAADAVRRDSIDFVLPAWTPGSYGRDSGSATVENFSVRDGHGNPIATRRITGGRWRLYPAGIDYLTIGYQVLPGFGSGPLAFQTLLGLQGGYTLGAALFGHLEGHEDRPVTLAFDLPSRWQVFTALDPLGPRRFAAGSFAALPGAPIVVGGRIQEYKLFVESRTHTVLVQGAAPDFAPDSLLTLIGETVRLGTRFYGPPPYDRYLFTVRFVPAGTVGIGATGQRAGSAYFLPVLDGDQVRQAGIGGVLLHQYLHAWYPGTFGPIDLIRPHFATVPPFTDAWLIEGTAEYYARLLPSRYGPAGRQPFYDAMGEILTLWRQLGGGATIDVRALHTVGGAGASTPRLVVGGALAAFVVDVAIRGDTRGRAGLEQVLTYLQRGASPTGYDPALVWDEAAAALSIPPEALSPLSRGAGLSIEEGLGRAGLRIVDDADHRRTLGARLAVDPSGGFVVRDIQRGGTAAAAGLRDGDLLVEINGTPIGPNETIATRYAMTNYIGEAPAGARITFGVIRDGQPLEEIGTVRESRLPRFRIVEVTGSSASALLVRSSLFSPLAAPAPTR